jgi:serine-type D-Ala-D-Ala carboxypeptidase (penicillin-binding protein 5/6)
MPCWRASESRCADVARLASKGTVRACLALVAAVLLFGAPSTAVGAPPKLDATAWILIDSRDDAVLASKAQNQRLPIASATKLMTAYLALKRLRPNQMIAAPAYQPRSSAEILLGLRQGERIRVRDLLAGALLPSANDAAQALAVGVSGSVPAFVAAMNQAAQRLGLADTHYANPIGFDDPGNYSSARDLVTLASILLRNKLFARIVDSQGATLRSGDQPRQVTTRNTLLSRVPWVSGVKTGHTLGAGYVLVGSGTQDSTTLVSAVLGAPGESVRDAETLELLQYGFSLYHPVQPVRRGEELADPQVDWRDDHLSLVAQRSLPVNVRQWQRVATQVRAPDEVSGPVEEGERLGRVTVSVDGRVAAASPLIAGDAVGAASTLDKVVWTAQNPFLLVGLGAIVILVGVLLTARGRRSREPEPANPGPRNGRRQEPRERTPEERRRMHEERMRRRRERMEREGGTG